jgi:hypothetical protein
VDDTDIAPGLGRCLTAGTTLATAVVGWFAVWSAPINGDEGYLLVSLREWVLRGGLYDRVYSQYGPFYYALFGLPARIFGEAWTVSAGRWTTLALWVVTAFLLGVAVSAITRSRLVGVAAQVVAFSMLSTLLNEPMHPGALLCALVAALVADIAWLRPRKPAAADALAGALLAALLLTKVNVGLFAIVAFAFVVGADAPRRIGRVGAAVALVALGPALLLVNGTESWRVLWASVYMAGAVLVVLASGLHRDVAATRFRLGAIALGFLVTAGTVVTVALVTGTSVGELVRGVVLRPLDHTNYVTVPVRLQSTAWCWLPAVAVVALVWSRTRAAWDGPRSRQVVAGARVIAGGVLLVSVLGDDSLLLVLHPAASRFALVPLAALVLLPRSSAPAPSSELVARRLLAAAAVTESLHAYPVPGSQVSWSVLLVGTAATVVVADGVADLRAALRSRVGPMAWFGAAAAGCLAIVLVFPSGFGAGAGLPGRQFEAWVDAYRTRTALGTADTSPLRPPAAQTHSIRMTASEVRRSCSTFVPLGADLSWYVVAGMRPPTGFNQPAWPVYLDADEQRAIIRAWHRASRPCLLLAAMGGRLEGTTLEPAPGIRRSLLVRWLERRQWRAAGDAPGLLVLRESR